MHELVAICILSLLVLVELFVIVRLVDRLMSRTYYDFKQSERVEKPQKPQTLKIEEEDNSDLGYLSDFR